MFNRILLPLDRSALAECVLPHTIAVARAFQSEVMLLHVLDAPREQQSRRAMDPLNWQIRRAQASAYLRETDARLRAAGLSTETRLLEGSPAEQVIGYSDAHAAQLIILSSHGQSGLSDWGVSSIVRDIAFRARTSVMIVRAARSPASAGANLRYLRILVPMDGTSRAEAILPDAVALGRAHGAQIVLAHIVQKPSMPRRTAASREDQELADRLVEHNQAEAARYLDELRSRMSGKVEARILVGDHPAAALNELVDQEKADLVLLSAHDRPGPPLGLNGDVVGNLIAYGTTPLVIKPDRPPARAVPPPAEEAGGGSGRP